MSDSQREIRECCMENISLIFNGPHYYTHLVCDGCNTRWDIRRDDE